MAAVEHREAIARKALSQHRVFVLLAVAAAYALTVLVFYPGYSTILGLVRRRHEHVAHASDSADSTGMCRIDFDLAPQTRNP